MPPKVGGKVFLYEFGGLDLSQNFSTFTDSTLN